MEEDFCHHAAHYCGARDEWCLLHIDLCCNYIIYIWRFDESRTASTQHTYMHDRWLPYHVCDCRQAWQKGEPMTGRLQCVESAHAHFPSE